MNSKQLAPTNLRTWLHSAKSELSKAGIPTARLDAELILSHVLDQDRSYLIAHDTTHITPSAHALADDFLKKRTQRIPLAYIFSNKEFYGRSFYVDQNVLIPRPETEQLIDIVKKYIFGDSSTILDVGTGSGIIAITLAAELPYLIIHGCDISKEALTVANINNQLVNDVVIFFHSDILKSVSQRYDLIVANLPYVDVEWKRSPETDYEPALALFAAGDGLQLIYQLVEQAPNRLKTNGYLMLEADPCQHDTIISFAQKHGFRSIESREYIVVLQTS